MSGRTKRSGSLTGLVLLAATNALAAPPGPAESTASWNLEVGLTGQYDYYSVTGNEGAGLYPFEGDKPSGELDVNFRHRFSAYRSLHAKALVLVNDSEYRSPYEGVVPERMSLVYESGEGLPFRAELGDSLAYFSQRTLERPLKGAALEIQGTIGDDERRWSLQAVSGGYRDSYRDFEIGEDWTSGASWLLNEPTLGTIGFHAIDSRRARDFRHGTALQHQTIYGAVYSRAFRVGSTKVVLDGEFDHLESRDVDDEGFKLSDKRKENGWFAQMRGSGSSPFSFRLRYEDFGRDYLPTGSPLTIPDRRSGEAHAAWRLSSGAEFRARAQLYRDDRESLNHLDTRVFGGTLSGPLLGGSTGLNAWIDYYYQDTENDTATIAQKVSTLNVDAWRGVRGWTPRLTVFWQDLKDEGVRELDRSTLQGQIRSNGPFQLAGMRGSFGPGVLYRRIRGDFNATDDWWPTFTVRLADGPHTFETAADYQSQNRVDDFGLDVNTLNYRLLYRFEKRHDWLELEFNTQARDPEFLEDTDSYRASVRWTHRFDAGSRPSSLSRSGGSNARMMAGQGTGPVDLTELLPGVAGSAVVRRFAAAGAATPTQSGDFRVWENRMLNEIDARQRVVVVERDGVVARSALLIEPPRGGGESDFIATFDRVRQVLFDRWGRPGAAYSQGEAGVDLFAAVNRGDFVRVYEWARPEGMIRLGIPRRLDGQVRIEVQFAEDFPALRDTLWGINGVQ